MKQAPGCVSLHRKFVDKLDVTHVATCEARDELGVALGTEQRPHPLKHRQSEAIPEWTTAASYHLRQIRDRG